MRGAAAPGARHGKLGGVLLLPGIMGAELDSVDVKGDRIWLNYARVILASTSDLGLQDDGKPAVSGLHVRPAGAHCKRLLLRARRDTPGRLQGRSRIHGRAGL